MSDVLPPTGQETGREPELDGTPRRKLTMARLLGIVLITVSVLTAYYLLVAYLGLQSGQALLQEKQEQQFNAQLVRQVELARQDIERESYALALTRLEWVLERAPSYEAAQVLQREAQKALEIYLTPQPEVVAVDEATSTPLPSPTPGVIGDPARELQRIRRLVDDEAWEEAVSALLTFQIQFPSYERPETNALLYDAHLHLGRQLVEGNKVELGLFHLEQAEKLGDLPQETADYRYWAELYLQGIAFYGVNWGAAAVYFRDLCLVAPFYQSSCEHLYQALKAHGDQYAVAADWCPAQSLYEEARQYDSDQELLQKLQSAREGCLSATPTPSAPITGTVPLTETEPSIDLGDE